MKAWYASIVMLLVTVQAQAQPQWRFHLAFEDATGAKDTLWFIYDTTATGGLDAHLGEVPVDWSPDVFNVRANVRLKIIASPYSSFPEGGMSVLEGMNYTPPLIVRWDTSLFHAPYLPATPTRYIRYAWLSNYYFWMSGTANMGTEAFSMLDVDSVVVRADLAEWFFISSWMGFSYENPDHTGIDERFLPSLGVFPNPARERVTLTAAEPLAEVLVVDALGKLVLVQRVHNSARVELDVGGLAPGSYFVHARGRDTMYRGRVVVE